MQERPEEEHIFTSQINSQTLHKKKAFDEFFTLKNQMDPLLAVKTFRSFIPLIHALKTFDETAKTKLKVVRPELAGLSNEASLCEALLEDMSRAITVYPDSIPSIAPQLIQDCRAQVLAMQPVTHKYIPKLAETAKQFKGKKFFMKILDVQGLELSEEDGEMMMKGTGRVKGAIMTMRQVLNESVKIYLLEQSLAAKTSLDPSLAEEKKRITTNERNSINVTIHGTSQESSIWIGAHAYLDLDKDTSWISRERLSRADEHKKTDFLSKLEPIVGEAPTIKFIGGETIPKHKITLTWYWGSKSVTRTTTFAVVERGVMDMLVGNDVVGNPTGENKNNGDGASTADAGAVPDRVEENVGEEKASSSGANIMP